VNRRTQLLLSALVAVAIFAILVLSLRATQPWTAPGATATDANVAKANDLDNLVDALFGPQVIPFEVLGVLLTAVMIGALVIARPLTVTGTEETSLVHPNLAPEGTSQVASPSDSADAPLPALAAAATPEEAQA
jgi:hypothetical protein